MHGAWSLRHLSFPAVYLTLLFLLVSFQGLDLLWKGVALDYFDQQQLSSLEIIDCHSNALQWLFLLLASIAFMGWIHVASHWRPERFFARSFILSMNIWQIAMAQLVRYQSEKYAVFSSRDECSIDMVASTVTFNFRVFRGKLRFRSWSF